MSLLKTITSQGVKFAEAKSERRNVMLSNYISLIVTGANILLFAGRLIFDPNRSFAALTLLPGTIFFLLPIVLNRYGHVRLSRVFLSWIPAIFIIYGGLVILNSASVFESSTYVGLRYLLLATCCIPLIVFDVRPIALFITGLAIPLVLLLFFDLVLNMFEFGYTEVGLNEPSYYFNNVRAFASVLIIGSIIILLKLMIARSERVNQALIKDLDSKNRTIQAQKDSEVLKLNEELKQNLKTLSEREFILNESQRMARIGSWEYKIEGASIFWSDEMYKIFGVDEHYSITRDTFIQLLAPEHRSLINDAFVKLLSSGDPFEYTVQAITPLRHSRWLKISAFPVRYNEKITGSRGICHDVSYFKEAEDQIRFNETKYRSLFEQASDAIMIVDFAGNFREVNMSLCSMLGLSKIDVLQTSINQLIIDHPGFDNDVLDCLRRGEQLFRQFVMKHQNGSFVDVEANLKKVGEDSVLVIARDTTELRKAQREITISEARFRGAFEDSAIGMTILAPDGKWLKVNRAFCQITGYSEAELLGMNFQQMTPDEDLQTDELIMERFRRGDIDTQRLQKRFWHKDGSFIWVNVNASLIRDARRDPLYFVTQFEDITAYKKVEEEKEHARAALSERIKELTTIYRASQILNDDQKAIDRAMQQVANALPTGWLYTEITVSRVVIEGKSFVCDNYIHPIHVQRASFITSYGASGFVEVGYTKDKPQVAEGPFLLEERNLIDVIAEMVRVFLDRKHEGNQLRRSQANLTATINNSETLIWSVDRDMKLLTFNKPFARHVQSTYGVEPHEGEAQYEITVEGEFSDYWKELTERWTGYFNRALSGEHFVTEQFSVGKLFHYSLSPIVVDGGIIGVSVFANDITEQRARENEMAEMNKKIGELKLMALRSVMNPHFIFNVLNSIQFFIAKNDRVNAINYLSTFSKLIRSILTHSTSNKIRLQDEIDMLKNYVELERTRFENKFHVDLHIDGNVDTESIEIPPLLIQPYVENAILHGLYNKTGPGALTIKIRDDNHSLIFEIWDDGIGRAAAQKLKEQSRPEHKSMGVQITEERLRLINELHNVSFEAIDLHDEAGAPTGTVVKVWIRY